MSMTGPLDPSDVRHALCGQCGRTAVDLRYQVDEKGFWRTDDQGRYLDSEDTDPLCVECLFFADDDINWWYRLMVRLAYLEGCADLQREYLASTPSNIEDPNG